MSCTNREARKTGRVRSRFGWRCALVAVIVAGQHGSSARGQCIEQQMLTECDVPEDFFGGAVSVSGDMAMVGSAMAECTVSGFANFCRGAPIFYRFNGSNWVELQRIEPLVFLGFTFFVDPIPFHFSLSEDTALVAMLHRVLFYRFDGTSWGEEDARFLRNAAGDRLVAGSVSLSGTAAVVGAPRSDCTGSIDCGGAFVFRFDGASWNEEQILTTSDAVVGAGFGNSVSMNGDTVVVGASGDACAAGDACGSAYVFRFEANSWVQEQKLTASDTAAGDAFGSSVSVSGGTIVVGAPGGEATYVFRFNGIGWDQGQKLTASDAAAVDQFGGSVSIDDNTVVVGARLNDCEAGTGCGSAYVFRFDGTGWFEDRKLVASEAGAADHFGASVSVSGSTVAVGAEFAGRDPGVFCGSAYTFDFNQPCLTCGNGNVDPSEACDGGLVCISCSCEPGFEPTVPPSLDCRAICGNGILDLGEACDGLNDAACPGGCLANCVCGPFCGDGICGPAEDLCSCAADCGPPPSGESPTTTCDDGLDNDCDGLIDSDDPDCAAIPTVSHWGMIFVTLVLLASAKIAFRRPGRLSGSVGRSN